MNQDLHNLAYKVIHMHGSVVTDYRIHHNEEAVHFLVGQMLIENPIICRDRINECYSTMREMLR